MNQIKNNVVSMPNNDRFLDPTQLTDRQLEGVYEEALKMEEWCANVKKVAFERMLGKRENIFLRRKLVLKRRATRIWDASRISTIKQILEENFYEQKPVTPCAVERLVKKGLVTEEQLIKTQEYIINRGDDTYDLVPLNSKKKSFFNKRNKQTASNKLTSDTF